MKRALCLLAAFVAAVPISHGKSISPKNHGIVPKPATRTAAGSAGGKSSQSAVADWAQPQPSIHDDAGIRAFIAQVRTRALKIKIDGEAGDWAGIPRYSRDAAKIADSSRAITSTSIAPLDDALLVMMKTRGKPSRDDRAFWLDIDYCGHSVDTDIRVGLNLRGPSRILIYEAHKPMQSANIENIEMAVKDVVEVRIPYSALAAMLPKSLSPYLADPGTHPFIRVKPVPWIARTNTYPGTGPAACSYRLLAAPYSLDAAQPAHVTPNAGIDMPVHGKWFITQGAFGLSTHKDSWAYDFAIADSSMSFTPVRDSHLVSQYYCWRQPVYAPLDGRILFARDTTADTVPVQDAEAYYAAKHNSPNFVLIDSGIGQKLLIEHLNQASLRVKVGDLFRAGQLIGLAGSSGAPTTHVHIGFVSLADNTTYPLALGHVRVSLNAGPTDPWARDLAFWEPREGYFVEPLENAVNAPHSGNQGSTGQK